MGASGIRRKLIRADSLQRDQTADGYLPSGRVKKPERNENNQPEIIKEDIHTPESEIRTKVLDFIKACEDNDMRLDEADVICIRGAA